MESVPVAVVDDARFDLHRAPGYHPERPERLVAARAGLDRALPKEARLHVKARAVSDDEAARAHTPAYVDELRRVLGTDSGNIDADTYYCSDTFEAAWFAAGGGVELCRALMAGASRRGIALLRPPGHHATSSRAMGFCFLNNVAIAAADAIARGAERVAIVDWDVHHGNGTQDIFYTDPRVLCISLHQSPLYPGTGSIEERGAGDGKGSNLNIPMPPHAGPAAYGEAFRSIVLPMLDDFSADVVLVSSGLDGHARDPLAQLELDAESYGAMTTALVGHAEKAGHGRVGIYLEGGYDLDAIEESMAAIARALRGETFELDDGPLKPTEERALSKAKRALTHNTVIGRR